MEILKKKHFRQFYKLNNNKLHTSYGQKKKFKLMSNFISINTFIGLIKLFAMSTYGIFLDSFSFQIPILLSLHHLENCPVFQTCLATALFIFAHFYCIFSSFILYLLFLLFLFN